MNSSLTIETQLLFYSTGLLLFTCLFPKFDIIDYKTNLGSQNLDRGKCTIKQYLNEYQPSFVFLLFHHM